jgi:AraC-like DNA-binding protein
MRRAVGLRPTGEKLIFVERLESVSGDLKAAMEPHRYGFFKIALVMQGTDARTRYAPEGYTFGNHSLVFSSPNSLISWNWIGTPFNDSLRGITVFFDLELLGGSAENGHFYERFPFYRHNALPFLPLTPLQAEEMHVWFERLNREFAGLAPDRYELLRVELEVLLLSVRRLYKAQASLATGEPAPRYSGNRLASAFHAMLEAHFSEKRKLEDYAQPLHVTPAHLSETIKKETGFTAAELIRRRLLHEAKVLLRQTTMTAAEISYALGFEEPPHFHRFFHRSTGLTPRCYREQAAVHS